MKLIEHFFYIQLADLSLIFSVSEIWFLISRKEHFFYIQLENRQICFYIKFFDFLFIWFLFSRKTFSLSN